MINNSTIMAVLESCPKHNMVAYLEKTKGNAEFYEVIDFLARSSIHHALTVSPVVSTTFVEQFWVSAKSKIINNVRYITAKVAGKPVSISKASIRSDLLFDDADGIDSLPNQAIFDAIQLMGYEGDLTVLTFNKALHLDAKKYFVMYPRFISIFLDKQLMNVPVPLDHFPINALTSKVFFFMVKKGKHFSGKVTPLFASMLVQSTEDEGATSERPSEPQPMPSPPHPSEANIKPQSDPSPKPSPTPHIPNSIPEVSSGNHGGQSSNDKSLSGNEGDMTLQSIYDLCISLCTQVTDQEKEIKQLKVQIKKLKKQAKPVITHHKAWMKSVSLKQRLAGKNLKVKLDAKGVCMQTGEEMWGVTRMESKVSTDSSKDSTDKEEEVPTRDKDVPIREKNKSLLLQSLQQTTPTWFGDDEIIAQVLLNMSQAKAVSREKEKGVELKDVEETERPRPTSTRSLFDLKPLPKIDQKIRGKENKVEDESDTESEEFIPELTAEPIAIRKQTAYRTQLRISNDDYLKMLENKKKHSDLKSKTFENTSFVNEKEVKRRDLRNKTQQGSPVTVEVTEQGTKKRKGGHIKMIARKMPRKQLDVDSDDEHRKCLWNCLHFKLMGTSEHSTISWSVVEFATRILKIGTVTYGKDKSNPLIVGSLLKLQDKVADKDGKIIKDQDQDLIKCLDTSSKNLRRIT
ncbi:hypothetical protein Tco_0128817 [Tanacetum coccineum]